MRRRNKCEDVQTDTDVCMVNKCPVDCQWAQWTQWSECSQSCGTGLRNRRRTIQNEAKFDGHRCLPNEAEQTEKCTAHSCPVHGNWSS